MYKQKRAPPESKLLRADTGGIKNPPSDSDCTSNSLNIKGKQAEQVPPLTFKKSQFPPE